MSNETDEIMMLRVSNSLAQASAVRVVGGLPDDMEVAALVAGLAAVVSAHEEPEPVAPQTSQWQNRSRRLGVANVRTGDSWRWSLHR